MNYKLIIIVLLLTTIVVWNQSYSQDKLKSTDDQILEYIECYPDCPNDVWLPQPASACNSTTITMNGCTFQVDYKYRYACNQYYDYLIRRIIPLSGNCNFDLLTFIEYAHAGILYNNPENFPYPEDEEDCVTNYRVLKGECWRDYYGEYLMACPPAEDCCIIEFEVCMEDGELVFTKIQSNGQGTICSDPVNCINVCP